MRERKTDTQTQRETETESDRGTDRHIDRERSELCYSITEILGNSLFLNLSLLTCINIQR